MDIVVTKQNFTILTVKNANVVPRKGETIALPGYMAIVDEVIWHMDCPKVWVEVQVK